MSNIYAFRWQNDEGDLTVRSIYLHNEKSVIIEMVRECLWVGIHI